MALPTLAESALLVLLAAVLTMLLNRLLHPLLVRYALARPIARSSHKVPTPQGGGIAVIGITLAMLVWLTISTTTPGISPPRLALLVGAAMLLALVGAVDDIRPLPVLLRLVLQFAAAIGLVMALPPDLAPLASLRVPVLLESAILVIGLVWFINLTNFMDGIDWITVVEMVPITAALALFSHIGALPKAAGLLALLLCGALIGFAPANRHVARLFLGDVGSLPIGALVGWMLIVLAGAGHLAAALILPLYYIADSGITLVQRWRRGEKIWQAHRSHYYQRALDKGFTVPQVTAEVLKVNIALAGLALVCVIVKEQIVSLSMLGLAAVLTAMLLHRLEQGKPMPAQP
jgi:UDP-N-acetylmuramyl pentapeptide phosphotransferase/UDP-N-acetylglucosamine-1-phosphate transferase